MERPNPQGSYQCGLIKPSRTIMLANSGPYINGKQRYAVNGVSYNALDTPLKLVDYFNIPRVFYFGSIPTYPNGGNNAYLQTSIMGDNFHEFMEILFQNWGRLCAVIAHRQLFLLCCRLCLILYSLHCILAI